MKQLLAILLLSVLIGCEKDPHIEPGKVVTDFKTELRKSDWVYYSYKLGEYETWTFLNDTLLQGKTSTDVRTYTYNLINDSFILYTHRDKYSSSFVPYANLKLNGDTIHWKYYYMDKYEVFLVKK